MAAGETEIQGGDGALSGSDSSEPTSHVTGGFREVVITTNEPERWRRFFEGPAGWEIRHRAPVDQGLKSLWKLPDGTTGEQIVYGHRGDDSGFVRVVNFDGLASAYIRPNAQAWDTGGIYDFNMRISDMDAMRDALMAVGWSAPNEPVQFTFDKYTVKQWIARGPEQTHIAFIERVAPPLEGWPNLNLASRAFNSSQIVSDMDAAVAFYRDVLGFKTYVTQSEAGEAPGPSAFGFPHNLTPEIVQNIHILHPQGTNEGSVELIAFEGATGANYAENATPYHLGLSALRFPVSNLDAFMDDINRKGQTLTSGPCEIDLFPYGTVRAISLAAPDGAWLDVFEAPRVTD